MWVMPILFGIGCAVAVMAAARSSDAYARPFAYALAAVWALANAAWWINALWLLPVLDLALGIMVLRSGRGILQVGFQ
jgi:hypothetical protein